MVFYMSKRLAESALLIGSMVLSNDSISHRQFTSIAPGPLDLEGSVVGPRALARMVFYMSESLAESALLIGSTVLSKKKTIKFGSPIHIYRPCGADIKLAARTSSLRWAYIACGGHV
jgi:hypothetical protein